MKIKNIVNSSDVLAERANKLKELRKKGDGKHKQTKTVEDINKTVVTAEPVKEEKPVRELTALEKLRAKLNGNPVDVDDNQASDTNEVIETDVEDDSEALEETKVITPIEIDTKDNSIETDEKDNSETLIDVKIESTDVDVESDTKSIDVSYKTGTKRTIANKVFMTPIDEPESDFEDEYVSDEKPSWYKRPNVITFGLGSLAVVGLLGAALIMNNMNSKKAESKVTQSSVVSKSSSSSSSSKTSSSKEVDKVDTVKSGLKKDAEASGIENNVDVSEIGGGYLLGAVTYYPNDVTKSYVDYSISKPETAQEQAKDDVAEKIEKTLKEKLPTINDTLKIKDKTKLTMETYKLKDGTYSTILLYDGKAFAYVTSDSDLNMVNHATTYYIKEVAA